MFSPRDSRALPSALFPLLPTSPPAAFSVAAGVGVDSSAVPPPSWTACVSSSTPWLSSVTSMWHGLSSLASATILATSSIVVGPADGTASPAVRSPPSPGCVSPRPSAAAPAAATLPRLASHSLLQYPSRASYGPAEPESPASAEAAASDPPDSDESSGSAGVPPSAPTAGEK